jgi:hypothetical protein
VDAPQILGRHRVTVREFASLEGSAYFHALVLLLAALCKVRLRFGSNMCDLIARVDRGATNATCRTCASFFRSKSW